MSVEDRLGKCLAAIERRAGERDQMLRYGRPTGRLNSSLHPKGP